MAFRALHPDIPLHVWRAPTSADLGPALARVALAEAHEADACEQTPEHAPMQMPLIAPHTHMADKVRLRPGLFSSTAPLASLMVCHPSMMRT
jgi:hypothetical protein